MDENWDRGSEPEGPRDWDADTDLWENQGNALTVRWLQVALRQAPEDLPVRVVLYDGTSERQELLPMEIGFTGVGLRPAAVVLTVTVQDL